MKWKAATRVALIALLAALAMNALLGIIIVLKGDFGDIEGKLLATTFALALFTVLAKKWATPPIAAAAIIAVLSSAVFVPYYLATQSFDRLAALPLPNLLSQLAVQGVLAAVVATVTFTRAAQLIGAGRVSAFPALVPGLAILIGVPITGEWPGPVQVLGIAVVVLGLLISIGAFHRPRR